MNIIKPSRLKNGDTIGIIATSGAIESNSKELDNAVKLFTAKGYKTVISKDIYARKNYLAGDDEIRIQNIHDFFKNEAINAIVCLRGGYGAIRLIEQIDYDIIRNNPKIFCGYSDVTALNLMFYKKAGLITYSGPMIMSDFGNPNLPPETLNNFFKAVTCSNYLIEGETTIYEGNAQGILWGGNLSTIVSLCGQNFIPSEPFIFFAEDINESVYKIDRMLTQLFNISQFRQNIQAICLGDFTNNGNPKWLTELFDEFSKKYKIPTATGFGFSHSEYKTTAAIGAKAFLKETNLFIEQ